MADPNYAARLDRILIPVLPADNRLFIFPWVNAAGSTSILCDTSNNNYNGTHWLCTIRLNASEMIMGCYSAIGNDLHRYLRKYLHLTRFTGDLKVSGCRYRRSGPHGTSKRDFAALYNGGTRYNSCDADDLDAILEIQIFPEISQLCFRRSAANSLRVSL